MMIQYNLSTIRERNRNFTDQSGRTVVFSLRLTAKRLISFLYEGIYFNSNYIHTYGNPVPKFKVLTVRSEEIRLFFSK